MCIFIIVNLNLIGENVGVRVVVFNATYFSYIVAVSFIGGGNWNTQRERPICHKSLTNLSYNVVSCTPRHERGSKLTTLMVIGTNCVGSFKSNYHTITTTM